jgi:Ca2+-binding EF-hand superfamily protein
MAERNRLEQLQEAFFYFDENHSGTIHIETLRDIITRSGEAMSHQDVEEFLQEAYNFADGSGNVDYNAFAQLMYSED